MDILKKPQRIVVREVNWLGDLVISLPALWAIRRKWPDARLVIMVSEALSSFFRGSLGKLVDEIIPFRFRKGLTGFADRWNFARNTLKPQKFDTAILFPNSFDSAMVMKMAGIPSINGYARDGRSMLLSNAISIPDEVHQLHQVHYYLNLVAELGAHGSSDESTLLIDEQALEKIKQLLPDGKGPFAAMGPGAAFGPAKSWFSERYAQLADQMIDGGRTPVFIGAPGSDEKMCTQILDKMASADRAILTAGKTDVAEMLALLSRCESFVGNDSGAMHAAGALGLATVGLFGSTEPDRTSPLGPRTRAITKRVECAPCMKRSCPLYPASDMACFKAIEVDDVLKALDDL